ncbi:MAG: SpoVR family protein [Candidatus Riflebacteria bacterium]|nr:SpoVR family protein [Candidatus Riflebacteria bacterium]
MELLILKDKLIMEECKRIARDHGLRFSDETIEYVTTNEDMIRLSPKGMIPTMYDYWVHDVYVLQDKGKYDLYPHNPYETVINTRPPLSFYNDNNPDWLNIMIFYHVIAHIDFFQNNVFFAKTWSDDFCGRALAHANVIKELRYEKGRWVDYVIEFARNMDNLVDFAGDLARPGETKTVSVAEAKFNYFFDEYLQEVVKVNTFRYVEELNRYNELAAKNDPATARNLFLAYVDQKFVDFALKFEKRIKTRKRVPGDVMEYVMEHSTKLNKAENDWMKHVIQIVRETSLYFQPQIRTKILNEGWASYWHEKLFLADPRLRTHEFDFSRINAGVVSLSRVGLNPYAVGLRMFKYLEAKADRGMLTYDFEKVGDYEARKAYDQKTGAGRQFIFDVRTYHADATAINQFIDQDFVNEFNLFVVGKRINKSRTAWEYYIKSRRAEDYKKKMLESLYHPPQIRVDQEITANSGALYLVHTFEGKELVREYIPNTMLGIEFLWGGKVILETHEIDVSSFEDMNREDLEKYFQEAEKVTLKWQKVRYTMQDRQLSREVMSTSVEKPA